MNRTDFLFLIFSLFLTQIAFSQEMIAVEKGEVMLDGYDLVSYFDGTPQKGNLSISTIYKDRKFIFKTQENKKLFEESPEKYYPEYGGWCAIAMTEGNFIIPDYSLFKIQDGRLLFFSVRAFFNGLTAWNKEPDKNLLKADHNFYVRYFPGTQK